MARPSQDARKSGSPTDVVPPGASTRRARRDPRGSGGRADQSISTRRDRHVEARRSRDPGRARLALRGELRGRRRRRATTRQWRPTLGERPRRTVVVARPLQLAPERFAMDLQAESRHTGANVPMRLVRDATHALRAPHESAHKYDDEEHAGAFSGRGAAASARCRDPGARRRARGVARRTVVALLAAVDDAVAADRSLAVGAARVGRVGVHRPVVALLGR